MKLIFDQNLSRHLVDRVRDVFPDSTHVIVQGLQTSTDRDVWEYAREHGFVIVSKDSDFRQLAFLYGPPPKVIWLRVGNISTAQVLQFILDRTEAIESFAGNEDEALLVIPHLPS